MSLLSDYRPNELLRRIQNRAEEGFRVNPGINPSSEGLTPKGEAAQRGKYRGEDISETPLVDSTTEYLRDAPAQRLRTHDLLILQVEYVFTYF